MNVKTDHNGGVSIVRVGETRLMYPILSDFSGRGQQPGRGRQEATS